MAQEKQTVLVFNDGSWQSQYLIQELKKNDQKSVKTFDLDTSIENGDLSTLKNLDFKRDYLAKLGEKAKDKDLVIWLHFTNEDYQKRNNNTEDSQDLETQIRFLKAEFPNIKFHYGYQFHARDKLKKIAMLPDEKGNLTEVGTKLKKDLEQARVDRQDAKVEKMKKDEEQAAKDREFTNKRSQEKRAAKAKESKAKIQEAEKTGEITKEESTILEKLDKDNISKEDLFKENTGVGDKGAQDLDEKPNIRKKNKPK